MIIDDKRVENTDILTLATVYKKEDRRSFIRTGRKDVTSEELWTSLMAEVMENQNSEAQRVLKMLIKKVLNLSVKFIFSDHKIISSNVTVRIYWGLQMNSSFLTTRYIELCPA